MKRISRVFLTVMLLAACDAAAAADCTLRVGWEPYAPYTYEDERGEVVGADVELVRAVAGEVGCAAAFVELPWARILREIENGTLDVSTSTSWTPERTGWARFSEPYRATEMAIYVRAGKVDRYELASLADIAAQEFRLGVITDYYYGEEYQALADDARYQPWIDGATDYATNIRKLIGGRIDGYLAEDVGVMAAELDSLGLADQVVRYPLQVTGEPLRLMFSRKTVGEELVDEVDAALERMRGDGRLAAIMSKYVP